MILERDAYRCALCGGYADTVDHVIPRSRGGDDSPGNLRAACGPCNIGRGDRDEHRNPRPAALPPPRRWAW